MVASTRVLRGAMRLSTMEPTRKVNGHGMRFQEKKKICSFFAWSHTIPSFFLEFIKLFNNLKNTQVDYSY
ncbi:MAG: hypothetical protein ACTSVY_13125 [Candidatus Helarchaeota archaeon]